MSIENIFPNKEQFDVMNVMLASIAQNADGLKMEKYTDIQQLVRLGVASKVIFAGDQLEVNKAASITAAVGTGSVITAAAVIFQTFLNKLGTCPAGVYVFTRANGAWYLLGKPVVLSQYGITTTGTETDGDVINVTVTGSVLTYDVGAADGYDVPADEEHTHALSLLLHDCFANVVFDQTEAMYYATEELAAGTYHFTLPDYDVAYGGNKTYQFTLTQTVPAGGQIMFPWGYQVQCTATKISTYASKTATSATESNVVVTEGSGGIDLGTVPSGTATANLNNVQRIRYGSNNWSESAMRQWLNSNAASGWWTAKTNFDRPQSTPTEGFLHGIDPDFLAVLGNVRKRTAKNTVSDGGGYEDADEFIFLPSFTELNFGQNNGVYETPVSGTTPKTTPYPLYTGAVNADRVKYLSGAARTWWVRSPHTGYARVERVVGADGGLDGGPACYALGAVPACCII